MKTEHRAFLGDAERTFRLTPELIAELERKTGAGIGELSRRLFGGDFRFNDVIETIRLALIGGGENPERAQELITLYIVPWPLSHSHPLAVAILECLWFGPQRLAEPVAPLQSAASEDLDDPNPDQAEPVAEPVAPLQSAAGGDHA